MQLQPADYCTGPDRPRILRQLGRVRDHLIAGLARKQLPAPIQASLPGRVNFISRAHSMTSADSTHAANRRIARFSSDGIHIVGGLGAVEPGSNRVRGLHATERVDAATEKECLFTATRFPRSASSSSNLLSERPMDMSPYDSDEVARSRPHRKN